VEWSEEQTYLTQKEKRMNKDTKILVDMIQMYLTDGYMEDCYTAKEQNEGAYHEAPTPEVARTMANTIVSNIIFHYTNDFPKMLAQQILDQSDEE
jgi:hypothetical protein